jgi:hypothetical protein
LHLAQLGGFGFHLLDALLHRGDFFLVAQIVVVRIGGLNVRLLSGELLIIFGHFERLMALKGISCFLLRPSSDSEGFHGSAL